jgi:hypothetical protein
VLHATATKGSASGHTSKNVSGRCMGPYAFRASGSEGLMCGPGGSSLRRSAHFIWFCLSMGGKTTGGTASLPRRRTTCLRRVGPHGSRRKCCAWGFMPHRQRKSCPEHRPNGFMSAVLPNRGGSLRRNYVTLSSFDSIHPPGLTLRNAAHGAQESRLLLRLGARAAAAVVRNAYLAAAMADWMRGLRGRRRCG